MSLRSLLLCLLSTLLAPSLAGGQRVISGQPVRLTLPADSVLHGVVDSVSQDRVWLRSGPQVEPIPLGRVQRMELRQYRRPALGKGVVYGALGGGLIGGALWLAFISGDYDDGTKGIFAAVFIGSGVVGGGLAGAGLSLILARERWVSVPRSQWTAGLLPGGWGFDSHRSSPLSGTSRLTLQSTVGVDLDSRL